MPLLGNYNFYTESCAPQGDGICDGFDPETDEECECSCHTDEDLPMTQQAVKEWHEDMWLHYWGDK